VNPNKALWEKGDFTRLAQTMRKSGDSLVRGLGIRTKKQWCSKEDYSALRASPLRGRPAGGPIACGDWSNRLVVCHGFESWSRRET